MLRETYPYYLASRSVSDNAELVVTNKYTNEPATRVARADRTVVEQAVAAAAEAFAATRKMAGYQRQAVLQHVVEHVAQRHEEMSQALAVEAGKPIRDARGEVTRLVDTFRIAAEEAVRIYGEWQPLDISARAAGYQALVRRFPLGPCGFITPFNFPMNLVAHKVAPAIAAGCPWVLKPASATPVGALILGEILAETDLPEGAFSILPCSSAEVDPLVTDERLKLLSFTGSPEVGWALKARAGKKRVTLELGGNAACIVDEGVDLDYAADRITIGAFYQSGQSCISVQRVVAHRAIYDELKTKLVERAAKLKLGNPLDEETFLGPLITEADAERVEQWVQEAVTAGAELLCGGHRQGAFFEATYLEGVDPRQKVSCIEVFGPVATLQPFDSFEEAVRVANDSVYGLQCGVFTQNIDRAFYAYEELDVGGVVINDMPSLRVDNMPYGGVKNSGQGREGVRYAIEEMTERKVLVLNRVGQF
ncbi:MAG: aldehyde dehydrogenase family protein [Phycisphaerae bacterium]|nr:aldehyde dehydrogenase family protein [Phycisphaerae bacterium]